MALIRLINPNTSPQTTAMMTAIARATLPAGFDIEGVTAPRGAPMILNEAQLKEGVKAVLEVGMADLDGVSAIIVSAFGDPGLDELRERLIIPVVGIFEASVREASAGGRRFGIATVTPDLVAIFQRKADELGLAHLYCGTRLTEGDPETLASQPAQLELALADAVERSLVEDGAEAVIIGGGPLGQAAVGLTNRFEAPVIAPIPAAVRRVVQMLQYA